MFLRVALAIHGADMDAVSVSYELMSRLLYCYPSVILKTCGTRQYHFNTNIVMESPSGSIDLLRTAVRAAQLCDAGSNVGVGLSRLPFQM
jgi:hypothetical protein